MTESLTTFAPVIEGAETLYPTGNLRVALPEIDAQARCRSLNILSQAERGVVAAVGSADAPLLAPTVLVNGFPQECEYEWAREGAWLPVATASPRGGSVAVRFVVPEREQGVAARIEYRNETDSEQQVSLRWAGEWGATQIHHFKPKVLSAPLAVREDPWTGVRTVFTGGDNLLLAVSWRPGPGAAFDRVQPPRGWATTRSATLGPGETLTHDLYVGVAPEPDGAGGTALHLRRCGFDALRSQTLEWLAAHSLRSGDAALDERLNLNLFFSYFYSQADCVDTGQPIMLTSRSPRYYVSGAFWSRDAYWWSFPAILLADAARARTILVESIRLAGANIAHHALYVTGTRLYPGFELDELTAPMIALWRYVSATGDDSVLEEAPLRGYLRHFDSELESWRHPETGLYGTFLLATDDPTDFPLVTSNNATVAVCFDILAHFTCEDDYAARAREVRQALKDHCLLTEQNRWAWAIDYQGNPEIREEPPLSLRTLSYWGLDDGSAYRNTVGWMVDDYQYHYEGPYPGAGAPHFESPSAFDLANRLLTGNRDLGDPVRAFVTTPLDTGIGCESWDPQTGVVVTGAAMASVAGFLAWTTWANLNGHTRWNAPFSLNRKIDS